VRERRKRRNRKKASVCMRERERKKSGVIEREKLERYREVKNKTRE
jgi:hypothetical protein